MERRPKRILLLDDSVATLRMVASVLDQAGFDVRTSTTIDQLTSTLGEWRPDLILTDVNMPDTSGNELCLRLKATYETAHVPVVLFSSMAVEELAVLARTCDADGFLIKRDLANLADELTRLIESLAF